MASGLCVDLNLEVQSLCCLGEAEVILVVTVPKTGLACGQDRLSGVGAELLPQLSGVYSLSSETYTMGRVKGICPSEG